MKKLVPFVTVLLNILLIASVQGQEPWIKVIGSSSLWVWPESIRETYDKGYMVHYFLTPTATVNNKITKLLKTDVNGNTLWEVTIKNLSEHVLIYGMDETPDGGFILYGDGGNYGINTPSPFIMKLNACMEKEWCKIDTANETTTAMDAIALPDGSYVIYRMDYAGSSNCLIKLNSYGQTIWKKFFASNNSIYRPGYMRLRYFEADSSLILAGYVQMNLTPDSMGQKRPYISKISIDGDVLWEFYEIPDTDYNNVITGNSIAIAPSGDLIMPLYHHQKAEFLRVNSLGEFISVSTLLPSDTNIHSVNSIEAFGNDKILQGIQTFTPSGSPLNGSIILTDINGNYINQAIIDDDFTSIVFDMALTSNNKVLSLSTYEPGGFSLMKFDENMAFASVDNNSYNYDFKCDYEIESAEIEVDCLTFGYNEQPINLGLVLTPNPSSDYLRIQLPDMIVTSENRGLYTVTSSNSNYLNNLVLQIYDINGKEIYHLDWPDNTFTQIIPLSGFRNGMHLVKVSGDNGIVVTGRILVAK